MIQRKSRGASRSRRGAWRSPRRWISCASTRTTGEALPRCSAKRSMRSSYSLSGETNAPAAIIEGEADLPNDAPAHGPHLRRVAGDAIAGRGERHAEPIEPVTSDLEPPERPGQ